MSSSDWELPNSVQPKSEDYGYDLERALGAIVGIRAMVPPDAFTADTLGTERTGNGVLIRDGIVLTIGYLITEAETIWLHLMDGRAVPATVLAYDQETGFGLVQALARLELPGLPLGHSNAAKVGDQVVVAGAGGRKHSVAARIAAKQEFAGNWEYVLDEAFFTAPAHPFWGGTAMIGGGGELLGIGSLQVQQVREIGTPEPLNMIVPIDLLEADPRRPAHHGAAKPSAASLAWPQRHRDRRQGGGGARRDRRAIAAGQPAHRRHRSGGGGRSGWRSRRVFPPGLVAGQGRGRGAADDLPRRPHLRGEGDLRRPQPLSQGAEPALSGRG